MYEYINYLFIRLTHSMRLNLTSDPIVSHHFWNGRARRSSVACARVTDIRLPGTYSVHGNMQIRCSSLQLILLAVRATSRRHVTRDVVTLRLWA